MKTILLTGVNGQVGHALRTQLADYQVTALSRDQLDLSNADQIRQVIQQVKPQLIINPAAYTAVDKAESEVELAHAINATAPQIMAEEAAKLGAQLIHFSTDYVYDGTKTAAYVETDTVNPVSVYGKTKLAGEDAIRAVGLPHLILRTSWVYGAYGKNFLKTILRLAAEREELRIVADQVGAPTNSTNIAEAVASLVKVLDAQDISFTGTYHLVNTGEVSWHGFASEIVSQYSALQAERGWPALLVKTISPIATTDYPTPAARPANSRLDTHQLKQVFGVALPAWQVGLREVMKSL